ncbi:MAG TPA: Na/Pi symporter [Chitinophagales bacterium]|nr:Na/Pi symporter [Chitinophagales bacterium]
MLISILKLCAGIGLFLFAMYLIEESLKNLSGRNFKRFLQYITKNRFGAVAGGAIVTAVLQSSSMVSLMVLAFVGAGVFSMKNAIAIILGANLGTTIDSWLVATLGFSVNIEVVAYPAVFVGGLMLIVFGKHKYTKYLSFFLIGFGLLFIGLSFMKTSMEAQVHTFDFSRYANMPLIVFLFIGFVITLLVQSSSVTMALTLTALHAGVVTFPLAAAIVLGSETGTTIKILLSAIGGNSAKKRVVLGNLLFNIFITLVAFLFLKPTLFLITDIFKISNPLISLVTFSSIVNLVGIIIFLPFLQPFSNFLEIFFKDSDAATTAFINHATTKEPETALDLFHRETAYFISNAMLLNLKQLGVDIAFFIENPAFKTINTKRKFYNKTVEEQYDFLCQLQGELQAFYLELRLKLEDENNNKLNQLIAVARNALYSIKSMNDIKSNITNLKNSSKDIKFNFFLHQKNEMLDLYNLMNSILISTKIQTLQTFKNLYAKIEENYNLSLFDFYKQAATTQIEDLDITIAINFNRALFTSNKDILIAIKGLVLDETSDNDFNESINY